MVDRAIMSRETEERTRRTPARKDKRRWCRGKVGVKHQLAIRQGDNYTYARRVCEQWQPGKRWTRWICCEQEYCTACGKILRHTLGEDCTKKLP